MHGKKSFIIDNIDVKFIKIIIYKAKIKIESNFKLYE